MRRTRTVLWAATAFYWVVLFVLTHLPPRRMLSGPGGDKLHHFLAYFVLAFLLGAAMWHAFPSRRRWAPILVVIAAAAYAAFDEVTQLLVGRFCELNDWLADVSGASFAAAALYLLQIYSARRARLRAAGTRVESQTTLAPESA
jgi:VanZ family protein